MKRTSPTASVTSVASSPRDEADRRARNYVIVMTIRMVCFLLMALVTPYGWYTWVFALGAAVLPYIAVVFANNGKAQRGATHERPERQLSGSVPEPVESNPAVVTLREERTSAQLEPPTSPRRGSAT